MPIRTVLVRLVAAVLLAFPAAGALSMDPELVSSMGIMQAEKNLGGFSIVPARGVPPRVYTEDYAPSQVFEIIRPDMMPFSVGRLLASCACLRVTMDKKDYAKGERALITVRNVKPSVAGGATYAIFVQLNAPFKEALQYDLFVKSDRRPEPAPAPVAITSRGHGPQMPPGQHVPMPAPPPPSPPAPHLPTMTQPGPQLPSPSLPDMQPRIPTPEPHRPPVVVAPGPQLTLPSPVRPTPTTPTPETLRPPDPAPPAPMPQTPPPIRPPDPGFRPPEPSPPQPIAPPVIPPVQRPEEPMPPVPVLPQGSGRP